MARDKTIVRDSIPSKAAPEQVDRQKSMDDFAEKYGDENAAHLLALCVDLDQNQNPELHAFLEKRPHLKGHAYLANDTLNTLVQKTARGIGSAKLIGDEQEAMRANLTLEGDGPLERLLVTRVVMCWLRLMYAENYKTDLMRANTAFSHIECADKELSRAHARYVRAIESLARVRKLVKIAEMADTQSRLLKERLNNQAGPMKPRLAIAGPKGA